jgi:hypothetical protein
MTRTPPRYQTPSETAAVARQAQDLFALADELVARAERLRDSAEQLLTTAHIDVRLWSIHSGFPTQRPLDLR